MEYQWYVHVTYFCSIAKEFIFAAAPNYRITLRTHLLTSLPKKDLNPLKELRFYITRKEQEPNNPKKVLGKAHV